MNMAALIIRAAAGHPAALSAMARTSNVDSPIARTAALMALDPPAPPLALAVVTGLLRQPPDHLLTPLRSVIADAVRTVRAPSAAALRHELRRRGRMHAVMMTLARCATHADDATLADLTNLASASPSSAAGCMHGLGAAGWQRLSRDQRRALVEAVTPKLATYAASFGAVWSALTDEERATAAALLNERSILVVMSVMDAEGWRRTPSSMRERWLQTALQSPEAPAILGGIWTAFNDDDQRAVCAAAVRTALDAVRMIECLGVDGWRHTAPDVRDALIRATLKQTWTAVHASMIWSALDERHQEQIVHAVAHDQDARQTLISLVGREAWQRTPLHIQEYARQFVSADREERLASVRLDLSPWVIVRCADGRWEVQPSSAHAAASSLWAPRTTALRSDAVAFWTALTMRDRMAIVTAAADNPGAMAALAARLGRAGWQETEDDVRVRILEVVAVDADAAARTVVALGDAVAEWRDVLLPAILGADARAGIELALRMNASWRDWMRNFNVSALRIGPAIGRSFR